MCLKKVVLGKTTINNDHHPNQIAKNNFRKSWFKIFFTKAVKKKKKKKLQKKYSFKQIQI